MDDVLTIEKCGEVDWVTLNRPHRLNALNATLTDALTDYFTNLYRNHSVRVVVLRGAGKAFCAGLDLQGFFEDGQPQDGDMMAVQTRIRDIYKAMRRCPQPIVALINGAACGGGLSLALASDIRMADTTARFNAAYIRVGLTGCDMGSSYFLPRLVGLSVASEMILTGRFVEAEEAGSIRLVSKVVAPDALATSADEIIEHMLTTSPLGLRLSKDALNFSVDAPSLDSAMAMEDRQQVLTAMTADHREALAAFAEKRRPDFTGK